jgi:hypothetical protein
MPNPRAATPPRIALRSGWRNAVANSIAAVIGMPQKRAATRMWAIRLRRAKRAKGADQPVTSLGFTSGLGLVPRVFRRHHRETAPKPKQAAIQMITLMVSLADPDIGVTTALIKRSLTRFYDTALQARCR